MTNLPTLYEYYTGGSITTGLSADQPYFTLNNKNITLYSGAMHYFRVPPEYWRDRLRKMRAAGLNVVETYVPWNLHEPEPGHFDFGQGGTDFQELLDIEKFLKIAQEEDLLAIVRPGPYICAEWEFGGMPSWLLREKGIKVRTSDERFVGYVKKYFAVLFAILTAFQFTKGGPIVAFQIENEYGSVRNNDFKYLEILKETFESNGLVELLFTSDTPLLGKNGQIPGVLYTANFKANANLQLKRLQEYQPGKASMVMEYWTGWFDHWTEVHNTRDLISYFTVLNDILKFPASVNLYMFHGGTNWGFMNGANILGIGWDNRGYNPDTTSYDYDAPLTEAGDYTDKYTVTRNVIKTYNDIPTKLPALPEEIPRVAYETVKIVGELSLNEIISKVEHHIKSHDLISMENLPINNNAGQSYGYVVYRKHNVDIPANSVLKIWGRVCDTALVLINGELKSKILKTQADMKEFGYWKSKDASLYLGEDSYKGATLDILVENYGRSNFGLYVKQHNQFKGLWQGNVSVNGENLYDWEIIPLEFKKKWTNSLEGWHQPKFGIGPALFKGVLNVKERNDTYIDMRGWNKGIVIINGFVLSRYLRIGPQQAAYLPAPFLKEGDNEIVIFEHFEPDDRIRFLNNQVYETLP
ncbi:hypothetical protein ILUMI_18705 [Ignelater luminosus]|uniref:Beta-galactosidase n=1 Tax=Ignelater luminosus TaxID=2038154 RepID=A0A8K0CHH2_IGNLU|nr:hypothetical protein ILUMI_18705 [Ignelater luminosus]